MLGVQAQHFAAKGQQGGDHAWQMMQTAPNSMRPGPVGMAKIRDDPGLKTVAGGQYSYRPRTPTRPVVQATPQLHLRKTSAYAEDPRSYVVLTRNASPRQKRIQHTINSTTKPPLTQQQQLQQQSDNPQSTAGKRISVEHYINIMRDSVHRLGHDADPIIDQLCFTSRRAQLDALFRLCPSIDFIDAGKVMSYLAAHDGEIQHLRTLARGNSVIPADHLREPSQASKAHQNHVMKKLNARNSTVLPDNMTAPTNGDDLGRINRNGVIDPSLGLKGSKGVNASLVLNNSARYRQEEAHSRTHAPVLEYGKTARNKTKTDVQTIFEDLEKQNTKKVVVGRHTSRPGYMDCKPDWSLISSSSPMAHKDADRFKTLANNSLPQHMRPTFKYMDPAHLGQTNNYTKLRNFKKFHTDIHRQMKDSMKAQTGGRNAGKCGLFLLVVLFVVFEVGYVILTFFSFFYIF